MFWRPKLTSPGAPHIFFLTRCRIFLSSFHVDGQPISALPREVLSFPALACGHDVLHCARHARIANQTVLIRTVLIRSSLFISSLHDLVAGDEGYAMDDIFYLETCTYHQICTNGVRSLATPTPHIHAIHAGEVLACAGRAPCAR